VEDTVRSFDSGEKVWSDRDEVLDMEVREPLDKVIPVRLTSDSWSRLHREARELGVGPTTLARMWILERLRQAPSRPKGRAVTRAPRRRSA
jgi:hypothetical protein